MKYFMPYKCHIILTCCSGSFMYFRRLTYFIINQNLGSMFENITWWNVLNLICDFKNIVIIALVLIRTS
jgi:hypothetical protein